MTATPFDFSAFGATSAESPELAETRELAVHLMHENGLSDWNFEFDQARKRAGQCNYGTRTLSLSSHLMPLWTEVQRRDVILHEIAHALTPGAGHGPAWQAMCRQIGADPSRTWGHNGEASAELPWKGTCPNGHEHGMARRPARNHSCRLCSNRYESRYLITWTRR